MARKTKKTLGEMLLENNVISEVQWEEAKQEERVTGQPIRKVLIKLGIISEEDMVNFIAQQMDIQKIELNNYLIDQKIIELVPEMLARKHQLIPILKIGNSLTCAMVDVFNIYALDEISVKTGLTIDPAVATEPEIKKAIDQHYTVQGSMGDIIEGLDKSNLGIKEGEEIEIKRLEDMVEEPPVIKLVNMMVSQAVREGASDVHIEPEEHKLMMRYRIDGVLHEKESPPKHFQSAIVSRIKVLAELNIAERRRPQDGRFEMKLEGRRIDIRVSSVPTIYGENVVMRLLDTSNIILGLNKIGFNVKVISEYKKILSKSNGIILVTGPTGSGKTSTLYSSLNTINSIDKSIVTIEDPVEYHLAGIRQIQVDAKVGLSFADGLRSILRQDPDIIMVGEIRDLETAEIAIQAALTGHLVFATLHANNAAGAITRLVDIGVEPFLLSSSIMGIIAQRLVRLYCKDCKGKGCKACLDTGYRGRTGIYELLLLNEGIRKLIMNKSAAEEIQKAGVESGMISMLDDGLKKVEDGVTSKEEVFRVTQEV